MTKTSDKVPNVYVPCRVMQHAWRPSDAYKKGPNYVQVVMCPRCETYRSQVITPRGAVVSTSYDYPGGYLLDGDSVGTQDRQSLRLRFLRTQPVGTEPKR